MRCVSNENIGRVNNVDFGTTTVKIVSELHWNDIAINTKFTGFTQIHFEKIVLK